MIFYRRLRPFKVISFDLDDTLYDNVPVMEKAEQSLCDYLSNKWPQCSSLSVEHWRERRMHYASTNPVLATNMTLLRRHTLQQELQQQLGQQGIAETQLSAEVDDAMEFFLNVRNQINVDAEVVDILQHCATRYPLIAITNGNADIHRIGLTDYFQAAWCPTELLRGKPTPDLFNAAIHELGIEPHQLLHIGDHPLSDVQGACAAGVQSVWLRQGAHANRRKLQSLPVVEITRLQQLEALL